MVPPVTVFTDVVHPHPGMVRGNDFKAAIFVAGGKNQCLTVFPFQLSIIYIGRCWRGDEVVEASVLEDEEADFALSIRHADVAQKCFHTDLLVRAVAINVSVGGNGDSNGRFDVQNAKICGENGARLVCIVRFFTHSDAIVPREKRHGVSVWERETIVHIVSASELRRLGIIQRNLLLRLTNIFTFKEFVGDFAVKSE